MDQFQPPAPLIKIFQSAKKLTWGHLDIPLLGIRHDWHRTPMNPPSVFSLAQDDDALWFIAVFPANNSPHPEAKPHAFTEELWKYDVAELFIADPVSGAYLEFNLAANAAWWACKFSEIRTPSADQPDFTSQIETHSDGSGSSQTIAAMRISLKFLKFEIDFGPNSTANITIIRDTPFHRYLSASKLPGPEPDFHQPKHFAPINYLPATQA